ncbi:MAG: hypothetical protein H6813_05350 [Phycisphaeraceae bacterium]|nr:hypothetical protein [Phycisphaeraceae bacterium]MCB9847810.1 hypothetical protein [Phycisphaeraceae bacterium]
MTRTNRAITTLATGALLLTALTACGDKNAGAGNSAGGAASGQAPAEQTPQVHARRYTHPVLEFSIAFPEDWNVKQDFETFAIIGVSPQEGDEDVFGENVSVVAQTAPPDMSLEDFAQLMYNGARDGLERFAPRGRSFEPIGEHDAARIDYVYSKGDLRIFSITFILLKDQIAYAINCNATQEEYDRYRATMLEIARSFRFTE